MKKVLIIAALAAAATLSGCAMTPYQPGVYFTKQKTPIDSPNNAMSCSKQGTATATNVLGAFAFGDASVAAAKKSVGISKVDSVDVDHFSVLGLFATSTTVVCGE